jgi:low affinity Fe/Cu permease
MRWMEKVSQAATDFVSSPWGTLTAIGLLAAWIAASPFLGWSGAWDRIDEVVFAASFLLLFLLQRSQTKATLSLQVKLNELLAAIHRASPQLINIENQSEEEVRRLHDRYQELQEMDAGSHSIEEASDDGR